MHVREQGQKTQDRDDFELQFVGLVRDALRQSVQPQEQTPNQNRDNRMTAMATMSTSVSPGAVMNDGRWWEAAG